MSALTKTDRKQITGMIAKLNEIRSDLDDLAVEYGEKFDNLSEKAQEGEKGTALQETVEELETVAQSTEELVDALSSLEEET